jgi:hypothetical protein
LILKKTFSACSDKQSGQKKNNFLPDFSKQNILIEFPWKLMRDFSRSGGADSLLSSLVPIPNINKTMQWLLQSSSNYPLCNKHPVSWTLSRKKHLFTLNFSTVLNRKKSLSTVIKMYVK